MPAPDILGIKARSKDIKMFQLINYKKKIAPRSDEPDTKDSNVFKCTKPCLIKVCFDDHNGLYYLKELQFSCVYRAY